MGKRHIFVEGRNPMARAYIGWQNEELSLYGLKEGYKNSADDLVDIALKRGKENRIDILDMYIFPIMHSYRHSIEISLKLIYRRVYGDLPSGKHDLIVIWDESIVKKVVKDLNLDLDSNDSKEIRRLIKELEGQDFKADVWRYLMNKEGSIYFTEWHFIDYLNLKKTMNYLYSFLDGMYYEVDDILSSY